MKLTTPDDPLESLLRRDAAHIAPQVPEGMDRRISRGIDRSGRPASRVRPFALWSSLAAAGLATAFVFIARPSRPASDPAADQAAAAQLAEAVKGMPAQIWESVQPTADAVLHDEPLRQEATALYSDARSAMGFLALNFLPDSTPEPVPQQG